MPEYDSLETLEEQIEDLEQLVEDGWQAVKSCASDIAGADSATRGLVSDEYRQTLLISAKACIDTLLERYEDLAQLSKINA